MTSTNHNDKSIESMLKIYKNMVAEVTCLETMFSGRHFTLDGHLIGSIGEAFAKENYGIDLAIASNPLYDGTVDNHYVQIKTVQQDRVAIRYPSQECGLSNLMLLVLYLNKNGCFYEVFNGPIDVLLNNGCRINSTGYINVSVNKLLSLQNTHNMYRLAQSKKVDAMLPIYKNKR